MRASHARAILVGPLMAATHLPRVFAPRAVIVHANRPAAAVRSAAATILPTAGVCRPRTARRVPRSLCGLHHPRGLMCIVSTRRVMRSDVPEACMHSRHVSSKARCRIVWRANRPQANTLSTRNRRVRVIAISCGGQRVPWARKA